MSALALDHISSNQRSVPTERFDRELDVWIGKDGQPAAMTVVCTTTTTYTHTTQLVCPTHLTIFMTAPCNWVVTNYPHQHTHCTTYC